MTDTNTTINVQNGNFVISNVNSNNMMRVFNTSSVLQIPREPAYPDFKTTESYSYPMSNAPAQYFKVRVEPIITWQTAQGPVTGRLLLDAQDQVLGNMQVLFSNGSELFTKIGNTIKHVDNVSTSPFSIPPIVPGTVYAVKDRYYDNSGYIDLVISKDQMKTVYWNGHSGGGANLTSTGTPVYGNTPDLISMFGGKVVFRTSDDVYDNISLYLGTDSNLYVYRHPTYSSGWGEAGKFQAQ